MKSENISELETNVMESIDSSPNGEMATAELGIVAKINYYRLTRLLKDMKKKNLVKSRKGTKKKSTYWRVAKKGK